MVNNFYEFAQQCAEAISNALEVDTVIINRELIRIAAAGKYKSRARTKIPSYYRLSEMIRTGKEFVQETSKSEVCAECPEKNICKEKVNIGVPIMDGKDLLGGIGITFITKKQLETFISKRESLIKFVRNIAELLASKIKEYEIARRLELNNSQLNAIFSSINDGIMITDINGNVVNCSDSIFKLVKVSKKTLIGQNVKDVFEKFDMEYTNEKQKTTKLNEIKLKNRKEMLLCSISQIVANNAVNGEIILLMEPKNIETAIYRKIHEQRIFKFDDMIGQSQAFREAVDLAKKVADFDSNVLILGESGTGKELFARSIHYNNGEIISPFIAVNCAAIPEALLESELFGYEEGAFTGAKQSGKPGKFELANGGTIFLDEIGDMPLHLQAKLLRVLQEQVVERIGGIRAIPIKARVISATNKNLKKMIEDKEFREDLYYRLNVFEINIPSLKERKDDIPLLVNHFITKYCDKLHITEKKIEDEAMTALIDYEWKGNIRELENTIEYLCCICTNDIISIDEVKRKIRINSNPNIKNTIKTDKINQFNECTSKKQEIRTIKELEKSEIEKALAEYGHSKEGKSEAAKALGISRATLYRKLKDYDI